MMLLTHLKADEKIKFGLIWEAALLSSLLGSVCGSNNECLEFGKGNNKNTVYEGKQQLIVGHLTASRVHVALRRR